MGESLRHAGVPSVLQSRQNNADAAVDWIERHALTRVVIKPLRSAGSDGVSICSSEPDVRADISRILGKENRVGTPNASFPVQEFLEGEEYVVNAVSADDFHHIFEFWECRKQTRWHDGHEVRIYDAEVLLDEEGERQQSLRDYIGAVLDAVGLRFGPSHAEVMYTRRGPVLIEVAARLQGSVDPTAVEAATGTSQVRLTVDAIARHPEFAHVAGHRRKPGHCYAVSLISHEHGILEAAPVIDQVRTLSSFFSLTSTLTPGAPVARTVDLFTSPGVVYLVHDSAAQVASDYRLLRQFEADGYRLRRNR
jgi:biotin carboxylase